MSKELTTLGEVGEMDDALAEMDGDVGNVDMFGLDEFGQPVGPDSLWGALIGGGVGTGAAILTRLVAKSDSKAYKYSEAIGLAAGALAGGVMLSFRRSRRMGWAAIATALVTNGLRQLEVLMEKKESDETSGWQGVEIEPAAAVPGGFGIPAIEPGYGIRGDLGVVTPEAGYAIPGSVSGPPALQGDYGLSANPAVQQTKILGGPAVSGMGAHYGATLFGN